MGPESAASPVLVVGEALIDIVRAPNTSPQEHVGGSPANVALGLGRLGVPVRFRTAIGRDARGRRIADHLAASGVAVDERSFCLSRTSTAVANISAGGEARYEFDLGWRLDEAVELGVSRIVHVGSVGCYLEPGAGVLLAKLRSWAGKAQVTFDPNIRPALVGERDAARKRTEEIATFCEVVKLSDQDAAWLYPGHSIERIVNRFQGLGARVVAVTMGSEGAIMASSEAQVAVPAVLVKAVDTVGAGDTFMAAIVASVAAGELGSDRASLLAAGRRSARAAAITVGRRGADLPTRAELPD